MNLKEEYLHKNSAVVKGLSLATEAENPTGAAVNDLVITYADSSLSKSYIHWPTFNQNTTGYASKLKLANEGILAQTDLEVTLAFAPSNEYATKATSTSTSVLDPDKQVLTIARKNVWNGASSIKDFEYTLVSHNLSGLTDWATVNTKTINSVNYTVFWKIAPTSTNQVYGWSVNPNNGLLYYIYNNKGTYSAASYSTNSTYTAMISIYCGTAAATAAKVGTSTNFGNLSDYTLVWVRFTTTNTASAPTLNINGTGAKTIKVNGNDVSTTNQLIAGYWPCYYDGTYWNVFTNGEIPAYGFRAIGGTFVGNLTGKADDSAKADTATTAEKFNSARTIALTGDVTGSASSDGTSGWSITTTVAKDTSITASSTETTIPCSKAVWDLVTTTVAGGVQYLGTVASSADMIALSSAGYGDFARVTTSFNFANASGKLVTAHVGDIVYLTSNAANAYSTASNWIVAHTEIDSNTWNANTKDAAGYVAAGSGYANCIWETDANGNPAWRSGATLVLTTASTTDSSYYLTFVDSNNTTTAAESLYTLANLTYNPSTRTFSIGTSESTGVLSVVGNFTLSGSFTASGLSSATANITDNTKLLTSNASGFSSSDYQVYQRPATAFWNYIKGKADGLYLTSGILTNANDSTTAFTEDNITDSEVTKTNPYINLLKGETVQNSFLFNSLKGIQIMATSPTLISVENTAGVYFVDGTQTAQTNVWTGELPAGVSDYYNGLLIRYRLPYAGTNSAATLNLGGKGAITLRRQGGNVTTHYNAGSIIVLTYYKPSGGNAYWWTDGDYNSDSNTWRGVYVNTTSVVGTGNNTKAINYITDENLTASYIASGTNTGLSGSANYFNVKLGLASTITLGTPSTASEDGTGYFKIYNRSTKNITTLGTSTTIQTSTATSDITLTLPNVSGTLAVDEQYSTTAALALSASTWADAFTPTSLTNGTYAIQICQNTSGAEVYASGVFSYYASDTGTEEIVLHHATKLAAGGTGYYVLYARINGGTIQLASSVTVTSRSYTITIKKLI